MSLALSAQPGHTAHLAHLAHLESVATLPGVQEALEKSPTLPPLAAADAPSLKSTATFVGSLLTAASALAWLVLPRIL